MWNHARGCLHNNKHETTGRTGAGYELCHSDEPYAKHEEAYKSIAINLKDLKVLEMKAPEIKQFTLRKVIK